MLFLLFHLDRDRYAIDVRQVAEVLPMLAVKRLPQAPPAVRGTFSYHGASVPLIDLCQLALDRPAHTRLSTRIILLHYPDASGQSRLLGLLAEHVTETINLAPSLFQESGVRLEHAPYLGPVASDARGLLQWIEIDKLLPAEVRDLLFQPVATA